MRHVFISYSTRDTEQAERIVRTLEDRGVRCWIAPRNLGIGFDYTKDIPAAIRECPCFLLVLSPNAQESIWVNKELAQAIDLKKRLLPLMIRDFPVSEGFTFLLKDVQTRPYHQDPDRYLGEVLTEIRQLCPDAVPAPAAPKRAPAECCRMGRAAWSAKQFAEAAALFREAAGQGDAEARFRLGGCCLNGRGTAQDTAQALELYRQAAGQDHVEAQLMLAFLLENGFCGAPKDPEEAALWFRRAAEQGDPNARNALKRLS